MPRHDPSPLHDQLTRLHSDLLDLHKALIEHERARYEQQGHTIAHAGEFLSLLLNDPFFAWLRTLSGLIAEIDEYLSSRKLPPTETGEALLATARTLLTPDKEGNDFQRQYAFAIQESPQVAALHAQWKTSMQ
jgi:hypothetical protein